MEPYRTEKMKYLIIGSISLLLILILVYGAITFLRSRSDATSEIITTPTPSPTPYRFPSSTPIPTAAVLPSLNPTEASSYSPVDQKLLDLRDEYEVLNRPDFYVHNRLPFDHELFSASSMPVVNADGSGYYAIYIYPKTDDEARVKAAVNAWLQSIAVPPTMIEKLVITYEPVARPL